MNRRLNIWVSVVAALLWSAAASAGTLTLAWDPNAEADVAGIASDAQWGFVLAVFKWVYASLSPIGGFIADRFSRRRVIAVSLFVWSAVTWWTGHVQTYEQLVTARALMGVSEAFYMPAGYKEYWVNQKNDQAVIP
jgi:MFS family permease